MYNTPRAATILVPLRRSSSFFLSLLFFILSVSVSVPILPICIVGHFERCTVGTGPQHLSPGSQKTSFKHSVIRANRQVLMNVAFAKRQQYEVTGCSCVLVRGVCVCVCMYVYEYVCVDMYVHSMRARM
jgi:hypothetical protein